MNRTGRRPERSRRLFAAATALIGLLASGPRVTSPSGVSSASRERPALEFFAPSFKAPYFRIRFPFDIKNEKLQVKDLSLNGVAVRSFLVFRHGQPVALNALLEPDVYDIILDYAWSSGKTYVAELRYQPAGKPTARTYQVKGVSPAEGGIPGGQEGFYRIYTIEEEVGLERTGETVILTLTAPADDLRGAEPVIYDGARPVVFEIMETGESGPAEKAAATQPATVSQKIVLRLSAAPREKRWLLVLKGKSPEPPVAGFRLSGEGLGKTVRSAELALEFSPRSGQINAIESTDPPVRLTNKVGVVHWNPDVFVQGLGWDHSFDWNPPPSFAERVGSFIYVNSRQGPLPRIPAALLDVKYTVAAGCRYFISETRLTFEQDLGVIAVRNDEMVLDKELFDTLVYKDKAGALVRRPLKEEDGLPFGLIHTAPPDVDWVGLLSAARGYGFFSLRVGAADGNFEVPGVFPLKAGTCFYAPSDGSYVYWVRPLIYTWADFFTNTLHTFVPKGSFFYEKNAYGIWRATDDLARRLDDELAKLKNPLRVY